jgi:hypothetical protein
MGNVLLIKGDTLADDSRYTIAQKAYIIHTLGAKIAVIQTN